MSGRRLPDITHLQYLVLAALREGDQPGRALRKLIAEFGARRSAAAFYQLMARLETAQLVEGWYAPIDVGAQTVNERRYRVTGTGRKAEAQARAFYQTAWQRVPRTRWSDA